MQEITINDEIALYINHRKLIARDYCIKNDTSTTCYTLRSELFNFKPPIRTSEEGSSTINTECASPANQRTSRKRKKRMMSEMATSSNNLTVKVQPFIDHIQNEIINSDTNTILEDMPRFWEEANDFPQFWGANETNDFQSTSFGDKTYIIPPQTKFFNYDIKKFDLILPKLEKYDLIVIDMPWRNKYIKRLNKVKSSLGYQLLSTDNLLLMPIGELLHQKTLVALWCTNCQQNQTSLLEEFLPAWNLKLLHCLKWFKVNIKGQLVNDIKAEGHKQPYETLYLAIHKDNSLTDPTLSKLKYLFSIPSIIHSHKPPLYQWLRKYMHSSLENPHKCLEIFARSLHPDFTSIGLEVLKLMDKRLYDHSNE